MALVFEVLVYDLEIVVEFNHHAQSTRRTIGIRIAQVIQAHGVGIVGITVLLHFGDGKTRPIEKNSAQFRFFRRQRDPSLLRLVKNPGAALRVKLPAGTLWIPADQPAFAVAVALLEPESPDSLLAWGLLSTLFERKEHFEPRVLEGIAEERLKDPAVAAEWRRALADPAFAADPAARAEWWYRRTPYRDETVGLLPVFRAMSPPALPHTEPWR